MTTIEKIQDKAMWLLNGFKDSAEAGDYKELSQRAEVKQALDILIGSSRLRIDQRVIKLCVDCFMFGFHLARKQYEPITDEEQIKLCINCKYLVSRNGQLMCKLDKCKYE